jgi:hypothetical protein
VKFYASHPGFRQRQIIGDSAVLCWAGLWLWIGRAVYDLVYQLGGAGRALQGASGDVQGVAGGVPGILSPVADGLTAVATTLSDAGSAQVSAVESIALLLAAMVVVPPIAPPLIWWIWKRVKWIVSSQRIAKLERLPHFDKLLAQRALMREPVERLARTSSDPVGDFAEGNYVALANLERKRLGLGPR